MLDDDEDFDDDDVEFDATAAEVVEENTVDVGCCFEGEDALLENVAGGNFNSARLRFTPCSTGSNSSERLRDATANILTNLKKENYQKNWISTTTTTTTMGVYI